MDTILRARLPKASEATIKTYGSTLRAMFYRKHARNVPIDVEWFKNEDVVLEDIKSGPIASQKTALLALRAILPDNQTYQLQFTEKNNEYRKWVDSQEKSETQKENWKSFAEIRSIYDAMAKELEPILKGKGEISQPDFMKLQRFVLLALTSGVWFPPRRSADWVNMKLRRVDKSADNYIEKNRFYFNEYKTKRTYGLQIVSIPKGLKRILDRYISQNPYDTLFVNNAGKPITNVDIALRLNQIFGAKISTSMLRHIFLSDKLKNVPKLTDLQDTARDMAHSLSEQIRYVKH